MTQICQEVKLRDGIPEKVMTTTAAEIEEDVNIFVDSESETDNQTTDTPAPYGANEETEEHKVNLSSG